MITEELSLLEFPTWTTVLAVASLSLGVLSALAITANVIRHPQHMTVMNIVWPVTALFGSALWVWAYLRWGRPMAKDSTTHHNRRPPMAVAVFTGTNHCGAGCSLGDLIAEWFVVLIPSLAVLGGYGWLFSEKIFAVWVLDFILAFLLGILFQYYAIKPMRDVSVRQGLSAALKADALSITAWQVGMYALMALAQFAVLPALFGGRAAVATPQFWWVMQIAMLAGLITSFPVNWYLIRSGAKERM